MDWEKCIICQKSKGEPLQCPAVSKRKDAGAGYISFAKNLVEFQKHGIIPTFLKISCLDEGQGITQTLSDRKASWHKSCRDLFSNTKLERVKKRKLDEIEDTERDEKDEKTSAEESSHLSPVKSRRSSHPKCLSENHCFFCDETDNLRNLHAASTFEVDQKVRKCAEALKDSKLLAKLSAGDMIAIEAN